MGRRGERGSFELLRRPPKYFCWTSCWASAFAFCPPSRCCPFYSIPEFPSSLPFPRCFLSISSSPPLPLPISPPCLPSSLVPHFSWPSSLRHVCSCFESSRSFSTFTTYFSLSPSLSSLVPLFPTFGAFNHRTNTPLSPLSSRCRPIHSHAPPHPPRRTPCISGAKNYHGDARAGGDTGVSYPCVGC